MPTGHATLSSHPFSPLGYAAVVQTLPFARRVKERVRMAKRHTNNRCQALSLKKELARSLPCPRMAALPCSALQAPFTRKCWSHSFGLLKESQGEAHAESVGPTTLVIRPLPCWRELNRSD